MCGVSRAINTYGIGDRTHRDVPESASTPALVCFNVYHRVAQYLKRLEKVLTRQAKFVEEKNACRFLESSSSFCVGLTSSPFPFFFSFSV